MSTTTVTEAQEQLRAAEARLAKAKTAADEANKAYKDLPLVMGTGVSDIEKAKTDVEAAEKEVKDAKDAMDKAKTMLNPIGPLSSIIQITDIQAKPDTDTFTAQFVEQENKFRTFMDQLAAEWVRKDGTFVRKDSKGKEVVQTDEDNCVLSGTKNCSDLLSNCAVNGDASKCLDTLKDTPSGTFTEEAIKKEVVKINPKTAYLILKTLHFISYLAPPQSLRLFKVQTVGQWLADLSASIGCPSPTPCPAGAARFPADFATNVMKLANTSANRGMFEYLDVLSGWVNANPQVLNPELFKETAFETLATYPPPNQSFTTFKHLSPYKAAEVRLTELACGLPRMRSSILAGMIGAQGNTAIYGIPPGMQQPFTRMAFQTPFPFSQLQQMQRGGAVHQMDFRSLQELNRPYGSEVFDAIGSSIDYLLASIPRGPRLSAGTQDSIKKKIEALKLLEKDLKEKTLELVERSQLYHASAGQIDAFGVPPDSWKAILQKHANLLDTSRKYNKEAVKLLDVYQTIANIVLSKIEARMGTATPSAAGQTRPLSMNFPK